MRLQEAKVVKHLKTASTDMSLYSRVASTYIQFMKV